MFYQLPPVGSPVCLHAKTYSATSSLLSSYQTLFYASGTAALAAAICAAIKVKNCSNAEIILPAYGCPDLVSAVVYAGATPVLVDIEAERPWLDLSQLADAITEKTVAIVAVNLFGIAERWTQLRELAEQAELVLIEDSAQYFPGGNEQTDWHGDLVILSFGRGKPVSLLGGGAVITKNISLFELLPKPEKLSITLFQRFLFGLKARLYNVMISPFVYWLPQALPFLHLGETRYHVLSGIDGMDQVREELLAANILHYRNDTEATHRFVNISNILDAMDQVINLPQVCGMKSSRRLLRYPLLLEAESRDHIYQQLNQAGLGVSTMYPDSLPGIDGLNHLFEKKDFPQAQAFASRLITLPVHANVSDKNIEKINSVLSKCLIDD
jgi:dTDP-4-amino-4,6-dideoxygalactose transaminase